LKKALQFRQPFVSIRPLGIKTTNDDKTHCPVFNQSDAGNIPARVIVNCKMLDVALESPRAVNTTLARPKRLLAECLADLADRDTGEYIGEQ